MSVEFSAELLENLKSRLSGDGLTCVLSDGTETFVSRKSGVRPLVEFIDSGRDFAGYYAADKIVGKAAALLYAYMKVSAIYASVASVDAVAVCEKFGIVLVYGEICPKIINRQGTDLCPMEKTVADHTEPHQAFLAIKAKLRELAKM